MKDITNEILLSIIIPAYNAEKYIIRCLNSIKCDPQIEIVIVNDGSLDKTLDKINEYKINRPNLKIISIPNSGVSAARNVGIENSIGRYVTFVDSDDWIDEGLYQEIISFLKNIKDDINILKIPIRYVYANSSKEIKFDFFEEVTLIERKEYSKKLYNMYIKSYQLANVFCMIYKRELLVGTKFDTNIKYGEDFLFNLDIILKSDNILFLNLEKKYNYYIDENSCSRIRNTKRLYTNFFDAKVVYYRLYEKMLQEEMPNEFMKLIKYRYLSEIEKTIRKLITTVNFCEFKKMIEDLYNDDIFMHMTEEYQNNKEIYNIYVWLLYRMKVYKIYYFLFRNIEKIKAYIKRSL